MKKPFSLFLALRYLKPKRTFVSIITVISILGVTLGITVLIVVISVMKGFELELQKKVLGFDPHIVVSRGEVMPDWEELAAEIAKVEGVKAVAPNTMGLAIAKFGNRYRAPVIRGIDLDAERGITDIEQFIYQGSYEDLGNGDACLIGSDLAYMLEITVGDTLSLTSSSNVEEVLSAIDEAEKEGGNNHDAFERIREMVLPTDLVVAGIFESGRYDYDSQFVIVPLHIGQEMAQMEGGVTSISVKTRDPFYAEGVKRAIMKRLGPTNIVRTWVDNNQTFFDAIRMERVVMFFILMFIIVVAAFGIMNTLITVTVQKTREIGILKALGARTPQIVGIFAFQGMVVGFFGTLTGLGMGILFVQFRNEVRAFLSNALGVTVFPAEVYQFSEIPAKIVPSDVAIICMSAFAICSVAALIPAYFAARLEPVKALRHE